MKKPRLKISFNAPVVLIFGAVCLVVMILNFITEGASNETVFMTYHSSLADPMTYIRLFTHVFGHVNWEHLISNMAYILLLGPMLEEKYGSITLLQIIGTIAFVTGVINYIFFWNVALCGASGICFTFILLSSFTSFKDGEIPLTFILVSLLYIGQQIYDGLFVQDNVSNMAHILGGVIGSLVGYNLNKKSKYGI